ncbi:CHAT domain-containing protein [Arthrobacter sp. P2b]|uniref:CHAT domain-containing protein n=1 Tax=Arthrobacter sp. P2b TaxID=1938741 RepID=UPI0009A7EECC|nr:CHAT domain-containing protein [Arthrobacter sp. P2b]SLK00920.1 CHAT domain-containing protein [Arthrobacter sp. P2b]
MNLESIASTDFVLLQADWPVDQARDLVEALLPARVIVQRREGNEEYFYLRSRDETLALLQPSTGVSVREAMGLHEGGAVPAIDALSSADKAPDYCVLLVANQVVGYFDVDEHVPSRTRGGTIPGTTTATPEEPSERSIEAEFPNTIRLNEMASLTVSVVDSASADSASGDRIPLALSAGSLIDILVQPKRGFVVEGPAERSLTISGAAETLPVQFRLRATESGAGQIRVLAFNGGIALGALTLVPTVVEPDQETGPSGREAHATALAPISVRLPDLSVLIEETRVDGVRGFSMRITASNASTNLNYKRYGPIFFQTDPGTYFEKLYTDIERYSLKTQTDRAIAVRQLAAKGSHLFETIVPIEARQKLWELRNSISTVIIQSEEPWIPWELCKLVGEEQGAVVEGPFLCEAFALTRWIPGTGLKPSLTLNNIALVVPRDSGLPYAVQEGDFIKSLATGGHEVTSISADFLKLHEALASGEYDAWHFTGHGGYRDPDPNRSVMILEDSKTFSPYNIAGVVKNLGKARPLVFLNACQIGRGGMTLTDIGGWAKQFLLAGAGAFIGAYWSVYDEPAYNFSRGLYQRLLDGKPIAQAAKEARLAIRSSGDPTWLAYTIFADPLATVQT